jgi:hypothetical protein
MVARIAALVAAVAMVVGAIVVRANLDDKALKTRLTCSTELAPACERLAGDGVSVTIEPAGTTADRLVALDPGTDPGLDGWLAAGPWPQIVDAARRSRAAEALFDGTSGVLGSTPLVAVLETKRAALVTGKCGATPDWACVGLLPATAWKALGGSESLGQVKAGISDPGTQAEGVGVLEAMATGTFKGRDFSVDDDALRQLLRTMRASRVQTGPDAVTTLLVSRGAELDMVFTSEAEALTVLASAADRNVATVLYPAPVTNLNAQLGSPASTPATRKLSDLLHDGSGARALTAAGWKAPASATGATDDPGVLAALRKVWQEQR